MGIAEQVKDIYFSWEERYYKLLDKVDSKIPIYKIIDPIDRIVPSFALSLLLFAIVIFLLGSIILGMLLVPTTSTLKINVIDDQGTPISNASVKFTIDGVVVSEPETDAFGNAELSGLNIDDSVEIEISKSGYLSDTKIVTIGELPFQTEIITLIEESRGYTTKTIRLVDSLGRGVTENFVLTFSCSNPYATPPNPVTLVPSDFGVASVDVPNNCENLRVSVGDDTAYESITSMEVTSDDFSIELQELDVDDAELIVNVSDVQGNPVDGISVELYRYNELAANPNVGPIDVDYSTNGQASFSVSPGDYVLKTYDASGVYGDEQSDMISLSSGESYTYNFTLMENIVGNIIIQVIDKDSKDPVDNARVTLEYESDGEELTTLITDADSNSIVTFNISRNVEYRAAVQADGYALAKQMGLRIGISTIVIEIEKCTPTTCGTMLVKVIDQDGFAVENATVALYNATTGFLGGYGERTSDINGVAKFSGVASGQYYAFAFKENASGRSDTGYFSSTQSDDNSVDLTVTMEVQDGIIEVNVTDKEGKPIAFPIISIYNNRDNSLIGSNYADSNGVFRLETKADKIVYIVVSKKDVSGAVAPYADYITVAKPVLPSTVQTFNVRMEPEIIDKEIELEFLGIYKDSLTVTTFGIGGEYTAKLHLRVPEENDYDEVGIHLRTGDEIIMEKDQIFIKSVNIPKTNIVKATSYDEDSGLPAEDYTVTASDAKWINAVWNNPESGIYEIEATIKIKESASVRDELPIHYRAWAENAGRIRYPEDELVTQELYAETLTEIYQVGVTTLCDSEFCFSASITDLGEDLTNSITNSYIAKIFNEYKMVFTLVNNSATRIHDNANLRIVNNDSSILFENYSIYDAQTQLIEGTVNGYEFDRIDVGRLGPKNKITGTIYFVTQKAMTGIINMRLVSDQTIVYEKNLTISISAPKELSVVVQPSIYPSGIETDINVFVTDKETELEVEDAIVRIMDRRDNVIIYALTGRDGYAYLTIPAQNPGERLTIEIEKPNYNVKRIEIEINPNVLEINPEQIGVSLNIKTRTDAEDRFTVENLTYFPLKITGIQLGGNFRALLDEGAIANWLEASYLNLTLDSGETEQMTLRTYLSDDGKVLDERTTLDGSLVIEVSNFGEKWSFTVPVTIVIGLGDEVDDPTCLTLTRSEWTTSTEGDPVQMEFQIQNNCTIAGQPVGLRELEAKVDWQSNHIGEYSITVGENETPLRPGYFRKLIMDIPAEQTFIAILTFTPYGGMHGTASADIVIQASNPMEDKPEVLETKIATQITVVNIKDCISFDRDLIEMSQGDTASFTITTRGCGEAVEFELDSELDLSMDEFSIPADGSQSVSVMAGNEYPGQYPVFVKAKFTSQRQEQLLHTIRARIFAPGCIQLSRYEFDVYDDPDDPYDGYDTAELQNQCYDKPVTIKVDMHDWITALKEGSTWGLITLGVSLLMHGTKDWFGGEEEGGEIGKYIATASVGGTVYGKNADGDWYNVKTGEKQTNKSLIDLLNQQAKPTKGAQIMPEGGQLPIEEGQEDEKLVGCCVKARGDCIEKPLTREEINEMCKSGYYSGLSCETDLPRTCGFIGGEEDGGTTPPAGETTMDVCCYKQEGGVCMQLRDKTEDYIESLCDRTGFLRSNRSCEEIEQQGKCTSITYFQSSSQSEETSSALLALWRGEEVSLPPVMFAEIGGDLQRETGLPVATGLASFGDFVPSIFGGGGIGGIIGGSAGQIVDTILGKGNPIQQALSGFLLGTISAYMSQGTETFTTIQDDVEIQDVRLLIVAGREEVVDEDISVTVEEDSETEINPENPQLHWETMGLVFTNETGFTTTETEPHYSLLRVEGIQHIYKDKTYNKDDFDVENERGWFDFSGGGEYIDPYSEELDEDEPEDVEQNFHLEFNSISPEIDLNQIRGLLNCQSGARTGVTGDVAFFGEKAPLRIKLDWDWSNISDNECDIGNDDFIYCDATQFSIEVLKKVNTIAAFLEDEGPNLICPSPLDVMVQTADIGSYDIGISKIMVERAGSNVDVSVDIKNNNPGEITTELEIYVVNVSTSERTDCAFDISPVTVLSEETVSCTFPLDSGLYSAHAEITPTIDCIDCLNNTASDSLGVGFTVGETGLEECEPYSTKRLADFFAASGFTGSSVEEILEKVEFRAHLIKDRYTADFQRDFDLYAMTESFFDAPSYYTDEATGLGIFFKDTELFDFGPKYGEADPEGYLLPGPGIYNVTIDITYEDDSWSLFKDGEPNATITIELDKADTPEPDSPFYYLPFDGPIASEGRVGYGLNFRGDVITINDDPEALRTIEIPGSTPIPMGELTVSVADDFKTLNNDNRGTVLTLVRGANPSLTYSPSYATPVMMKITNNADEAWAFYSIGVDGDAINVGPSMSKWHGIGYGCRSFDDKAVIEDFWETSDMHGMNTDCALIGGEYAATTYGFEFCDPVKFGNLYLKTIFYTPQGRDSLMKAYVGNDSMQLYGNIIGSQVDLPGTMEFSQEINNVENILDLVKAGHVCVSSTDTKAEFWWNPKDIYEAESFLEYEDEAINNCIGS